MELDGLEYGQKTARESSSYVQELPEEILEIIRLQNSPQFLGALSSAALQPELTLQLFTQFESVFADSCARWISKSGDQRSEVIEAFARILPLAPHLSPFLLKYLEVPAQELRTPKILCLRKDNHESLKGLSSLQLQRILLATYRLLNFDKQSYSETLSGSLIQSLFQHGDRAIRYLAVRVFCQLRSAADFKLEQLINEHVGKSDAVMGDYDGQLKDLGFLSLFEEKRLQDAQKLKGPQNTSSIYGLNVEGLSPLVARYSSILLPRPNGLPLRPSTLVTTSTTARNMETFAKTLLASSPVLLHGLAGSGKTSLVNDFARELGVDSNMVTLHLNEQTDAKMLIGMYATGSTPGSFAWRAGVLTTAVREGRWIFIEDLDRAPNEVISVILPLIERGELLIPSREETIKAGPGFKLLASIRTSLSVTGHENPPALHMLGARLWQRVPVQMPSQDEFREIIDGNHPRLHQFLPQIISVYDRLYTLSHKSSFASRTRTSLGRPISPRDLLKWCRRLDNVLSVAGLKTGREPISPATEYEMFLEATDCFASSLQTEETRKAVISCIAEEMNIDPQRVEHFLAAHIPRYEEGEKQLMIGRVRLSKRSPGRVSKPVKKSRPFANTNHAKRLLEQVGVAVKMAEPVLLVGETGIGKTTVVQQLADSLGYKLTAVNLSQQSEVGDLLGGFKPVNIRSLAIPLKDEFHDLFAATGISATKNQKYIEQLGKAVAKSQWTKASRLWREAPKMFTNILSELEKRELTNGRSTAEQPSKRRKTESKLQSLLHLKPRWERFSQTLDQFDTQLSRGSKGFAFTFIEGNIVKAARNGDWVLLDEINLASPDTLESIADLLHSGTGSTPSILLSETGEIERVQAHPDFRIFGAMNPATDVGKRDLPMGLRSRFTEIYVESPDRNFDDLLGVIKAYLKGTSKNDDKAAQDIANLYMETKAMADQKGLVDGANQVPHFSLRTLTRVLSYATEIAPLYGLRRSLYEGFSMGFLTLLNKESEKLLTPKINKHLLESHGNPRALLAQIPRKPQDGKNYVDFRNRYWMLQGTEEPQEQPHYIITPFVERNMLNLVRASSTRRFPVLVQGPTSSGKTSMIEYLAKMSGNKFVRINNHEHTDLQEYLGTYVSASDGQLRFQEGLLVQALRQGHWIVLDELNLAPTDVLEALNRLLDDNRELLIPETQEIVRPHDNFMLFATQNPPGLYGGRKTLSRAFRNRFLELHFDDIPEDELDTILEKRSQNFAPSHCRKIVKVYKELSKLRQSSRLFEQKDSFATLRDLFRWALREADNEQQLAENGYMLLAERVRNPEERLAVKGVIESVFAKPFGIKIDPNNLYNASLSPEIKAYDATSNAQGVVWTNAMRRLYVLVARALRNNEPVLLVGETGCGKTTVCQMLADAFGKQLNIVNAHQNTETGDLIGAQRPIRNRAVILEQLRQDLLILVNALGSQTSNGALHEDLDTLLETYRTLTVSKLATVPEELLERIKANEVKSKSLFEWSDGSLVQAMKESQFFLLDEISLADDSVLERLNSVLEPSRTILLAEKGVEDSFVQATDGFQFFATMNPGGDYGKRELSPALRNRFTEIWVPSLSEHEDVLQIVETKLSSEFKEFAKPMVLFAEWFGQTYRSSASTSISVRDVLAWVKFITGCASTDPYFAVLHGAAMVYIDTLGANPAALLAINPETIREERSKCLVTLGKLLQHDVSTIYSSPVELISQNQQLTIGSFSITKQAGHNADAGFAFDAPTTKLNAMRVLRALQVQKPILIEGSPGVGKTTLIAALARACGNPLTRINLSEQTDLMDLFGSDVPVEGAEAGHFAWRDAPFLQAMQKGEWVLLDEMNLASQSVLEGLNACLDHRGEVYISELDQTFKRHPNFSVFAAQNPHHQGGGRKGLPASFVNRFTVVYADVFRNEDLELICKHNFPEMPEELVRTIIQFVSQLEQEIVHKKRFGSQGGPWEFNLRDILRWLQLLASSAPLLATRSPSDFLNLIFRLRFRSPRDRQEVDRIFTQVFGTSVPFRHFFHNMSSEAYQVGLAYMSRDVLIQRLPFPATNPTLRLPEIESIMICIQQNLPCILVGPSGAGKTSTLQHLAATSGKDLVVFPLNADVDTMDLVGGFEQVDPQRAASAFLSQLRDFIESRVSEHMPSEIPDEAIEILELLTYRSQASSSVFSELSFHLHALEQKTPQQGFRKLAEDCATLAATPMVLETARFEWVDGVLVKALEQGRWLVLDNANLCSASVLDRLNSLLEPNGFLSINEHCGPDGEPKIVKPHPEFRIFLTMDARFGELSRAMRNRAIEIFLEPLLLDLSIESKIVASKAEPARHRFSTLSKALEIGRSDEDQMQLVPAVALDNLAWSDMALLQRYSQAMQSTAEFATLCLQYSQIYTAEEHRQFRVAVGRMLDKLAAKTGLARSFRDAQIIHPLQNSPLVPLLQHSSDTDQVYWLAVCFELKLGIATALAAQRGQEATLETIKPSRMNRLQRSLVSSRVPAVAKDSTVRVSNFLTNTLKALDAYLQNEVEEDEDEEYEHWKFQKGSLTFLLRYWWDTYNLVTSPTYQEATFQAHLAIGTDLITHLSEDDPTQGEQNPVIEAFHWSLSTSFNSGFKLTTGLSMEALWKEIRPIVLSSKQVLDNLRQIEQLAARFDALRWTTSAPIDKIGVVMAYLVKAYRNIFAASSSAANAEDFVQLVDDELRALEARIRKDDAATKPFLVAQFESLRQFKTIDMIRELQQVETIPDEDIMVLADFPTTSAMRFQSVGRVPQLFRAIDLLWGSGQGLLPVTTTLPGNLLHRLNGIGEVDLRSLKLLETELPIMGETLASSSQVLCKDQLRSLNDILSSLIVSTTRALGGQDTEYSDDLESSVLTLDLKTITLENIDKQDTSRVNFNAPPHVASVLQSHFYTASIAIEASNKNLKDPVQYSALAWVHFAIGAIILYVPDRSFDPDKRQRLERERHIRLSQTLKNKLSALRQFEQTFTSQDSNLRCQLLEQEISELGEPATVLLEIYRPTVSELDQLQGEFKNLLKTVVQSEPHAKVVEYFSTGDQTGLQEINLMQNNVVQIIRRLNERFQAYSDLTVPVVDMLRCLQIGLSLAATASAALSPKEETSSALRRMTPFLGGGPTDVDENIITSQPMEFLALMATTSTIEGVEAFEPNLRQSLLKAFHTCYEGWSKRLESDRLDAESKAGLYRFRGSAEDEEEEDQEQFNELFPAYDDDSHKEVNGASVPHTTRDTAVGLANIHSNIFLGGNTPSQSLLSLVRQVSRKIGALHDGEPHFDQQNGNSALLPGTLLLMNDQIEALSSTATVPETYNFYTDANLPETRNLVTLVHQIQVRFRELQAVDEIGHMQPLEDVMVSCRDLLQLRHTEPLAKIIMKVEKIHAFLHEWQFGGWASRQNSALILYDGITSTIVNWRRLELSTWAKLFDMEIRACNDDARSWWFVAYQVIIAKPVSISESREELQSYAQELVKVLETYFSTAIMGQFAQRLQLLKQIQKHLELVIIDFPSMSIIHNALSNFIALYTRYEKPVEDNLKKGRAVLEKAMRDVLLLASWKDTNIVALRDSAKRSHHKLFKVVRKFRSLLGQPMDAILKAGVPEENAEDSTDSFLSCPVQLPSVDESAVAFCAGSVPKWSEKSKRFTNVSKTVSMMADASQIPDSAVEGSTYLDSFLSNIVRSTAELQKATPSILTDDNKTIVKHLKTRKRKLFADTLKDLRQMGISYNLGVNALSKQNSLSAVLSSVEPIASLKGFDSQRLEYYFHQSLHLATRAREVVHQHSEDLSSAEVARSTGFLEGLLQVSLAQRNILSSSVRSMATLEQAVKVSKALWDPNGYSIRNRKGSSSHRQLLRWLPNILGVALDITQIHGKLGKIDNSEVQSLISGWIATFEAHVRDRDAIAELPPNIGSTKQQDLESLINDSTTQLEVEIGEVSEKQPDLSFVINQILPWTKITCQSEEATSVKTIPDLDQKLSTICDTILVAIEKHKKSIKDLPSSTEDPGWLLTNDTCLADSIKALHCNNITRQLGEAFYILRTLNLDEEATSKAAGAVFTVALPILQQYFSILQQAVIRYAQLHRATCKASYILSKTFIQIASQGFCTPSEKSDAQDGKTDKLEGGTGLGDGEGADDISKDIQDDENLDELAQEPDTGNKDEIEDEKDAVDMADADMEGEMGEGEDKGSDDEGSGDEESGDEMDEEAGDVDDLDPNAVDEKMWDGDGEQAEKDQEGDESKGKQSKDEQVAAQDNVKEAPDGGDEGEEEDDEEMGAEQGEEVTQQDDVEKHDPHAQDGDALDLPEDMELDGDEEEGSDASDDGIGDLSDAEDITEGDTVETDGKDEAEGENVDPQEDQEMGDDMDIIDLDEEDKEDEGAEKTEEAGEKAESESEEQPPEDPEGLLRDRDDEANADADNAVPSDVQGVGEDQDENAPEDNTESANKAQRDDGGQGGDSSEQKEAAAQDGEKGRQANGDAPQDSRDETQDSADAQPFKKLGDALESWHRQQTQIREAPESNEQGQDQNRDMNAESTEFQHLQDEDAEADTQAMGTATEEQAHRLDDSMAIDPENTEMPDQFQPDEAEDNGFKQDDVMDLEDPSTPQEKHPSDPSEGRAGASINQAKQNLDEDIDNNHAHGQEALEDDVEEVDRELESTHISQPDLLSLRSASDARQQWTHYESQTRDLSLSLTEQLRLILAPTLATKMRGDFRTGKRLNIKRIIPYIASQYKRDRIWMRRSVPSKRSYQIMLAVDDSKSMAESGSGALAFETLVMVSKSLSMLEVGEICVVGFGDEVRVAHDFDTPFSSDAGPKVFQNFGFEQNGTDVTKLVRESIELFRAARAKASSSPSDLWQVELIISDGVCNSSQHEPIRRLLRQALEERIMMVFVIVDDMKKKKAGDQSVLDLREAKFTKNEITGEMGVTTERYLDTFPFQYYLIVSDVKELPGVLATLLRQWFAEVVDSSN